ncbi:FIST signal transduction protein [Thalassospira sp.]|uniref:FIST signal transduction protein n=1 Tax=Thalassospira sp. TaxID=1912094 RepID=UPI003AA82C73
MTAEFRAAHASGENWASVASELAELLEKEPLPEQALAFLYVSEPLAEDLGSILTFLRSRLSIEHWVGASGVGICGSGRAYFGVPAASVMVAPFARDEFHIFEPLKTEADLDAAGLQQAIDRLQPIFGLVHGDPTAPESLANLTELARLGSTYLVGGIASGERGAPQIADRVVGGGLSGVLFDGRTSVQVGISQACIPVGPVHRVTEGREGVVATLDDRPALDVLKEELETDGGEQSMASGRYHAALMVPGSDTGDFVVRNLLGIDPQNNMIAISGDVQAGDAIRFVRRDGGAAEHDLRRMLGDLQKRLPSKPRGALYCSCVARGPHLFGTESREMMIIRDELGDLPLTGFYGSGEICNDRFYGYTGVLTLFI